MSRAPLENVNMIDMDPGIGDHQNLPRSVPSRASQRAPDFVDGSGPIFSMYLEMAAEEDKRLAESWKADADGILIFTGLFSAAVASLISVSIQDIRPNSQNTSNFYLANIYQAIADPNRPNISLPSSPPTFSPPNYAVWVNSLWFMSFVISLTCALLATLLQQWARRYIEVTHPRCSPHKRAQIRAYFSEGVKKFLLPWVVEALPTLLHISLFLFFAGLVVFLCNVHITLFKMVLSWVGVCTALYGCITLIPIFRHDSPYYTPLTSLAWFTISGIRFITFRALQKLTALDYEAYYRFRHLEKSYRKLLVQGIQKTAEEAALESPSEILTRAFLWTFDRLDEDHELERFFSGLPGFRSSKVIDDPLPGLTTEQKRKLCHAAIGLFDHTFSSNLLPQSVKSRRAIICAKALDPTTFPIDHRQIIRRIIFDDRCRGLQTAEFGHLVRGWGDGGGRETALVVQAICTSIVARAQRHDDPRLIFASRELGVPEAILRDYAAHGDSLSLAILIHVTRQQLSHFRDPSWLPFEYSVILEAASKFNAQDTSSELQHEFCALWNQIVLQAQNDDLYYRWMASKILGPIRGVYLALHQDTDAAPTRFSASTSLLDDIIFDPASYPLCDIPGHHPGSTPHRPHIHNVSAPMTFPSIPAPLRIYENLAYVLPPNDNISVPASLQPAYRPTYEILATSSDLVTAGAIPDIFTLGMSTSHPTPETPASASPLPYTSPPAVVAALRPDLRAPSDAPNIPSSASNPVLDDVLLTGTPLSLRSPITSSGLSPSYLESRRPIIATTPGASPEPASARDLGAAVEDNGNPKPGLRKEKDALYSVNRAKNTLELPPRSPLLPSVPDSDVDIAPCSLQEPNAERT